MSWGGWSFCADAGLRTPWPCLTPAPRRHSPTRLLWCAKRCLTRPSAASPPPGKSRSPSHRETKRANLSSIRSEFASPLSREPARPYEIRGKSPHLDGTRNPPRKVRTSRVEKLGTIAVLARCGNNRDSHIGPKRRRTPNAGCFRSHFAVFGVSSQGLPIARHDNLPTSGKNRLPGQALFPTSAKNGSVHQHNPIQQGNSGRTGPQNFPIALAR